MEVFKNLTPEVPGYQRAERSGGGVAQEVEVTDLLGDDAQPRAGAESFYLWAEDLAESHVPEVQGCLVGDGCAAHSALAATAAAAGRDSASATTLVVPGKYFSWLVYSEIKAR